MSDTLPQIARCAARQGGVCYMTAEERAAVDAMATNRGNEMRATPLVISDAPFLEPSAPLTECRPPWMHLYLHGKTRCECGARMLEMTVADLARFGLLFGVHGTTISRISGRDHPAKGA